MSRTGYGILLYRLYRLLIISFLSTFLHVFQYKRIRILVLFNRLGTIADLAIIVRSRMIVTPSNPNVCKKKMNFQWICNKDCRVAFRRKNQGPIGMNHCAFTAGQDVCSRLQNQAKCDSAAVTTIPLKFYFSDTFRLLKVAIIARTNYNCYM